MQIGICSDIQEEIVAIAKEIIQNADFLNEDKMFFFTVEDLMFDIEMERVVCDILIMKIEYANYDKSGIDVVEQIINQHPEVQIIFFSHGYDFVSEVYRVPHCFFVRYQDIPQYIRMSISIARNNIHTQKGNLLEVIHKRKKINVDCSEILYVRKEQRQTIISTKKKEYICYMALNDILRQGKKSLIRCHTGYIVNINCVIGMEKSYLLLNNEEKIPLGRAYKKGVKDRYMKN